jgi:hypothetical protein
MLSALSYIPIHEARRDSATGSAAARVSIPANESAPTPLTFSSRTQATSIVTRTDHTTVETNQPEGQCENAANSTSHRWAAGVIGVDREPAGQ